MQCVYAAYSVQHIVCSIRYAVLMCSACSIGTLPHDTVGVMRQCSLCVYSESQFSQSDDYLTVIYSVWWLISSAKYFTQKRPTILVTIICIFGEIWDRLSFDIALGMNLDLDHDSCTQIMVPWSMDIVTVNMMIEHNVLWWWWVHESSKYVHPSL